MQKEVAVVQDSGDDFVFSVRRELFLSKRYVQIDSDGDARTLLECFAKGKYLSYGYGVLIRVVGKLHVEEFSFKLESILS